MKNTRLKNVIATAGVAIFSGVLLLGVNAAIGASTPTAEPPGLGVSPTFSGLNVNGNVSVEGNAGISGNLATKEIIAEGIELTDWFLGNGGGYFSELNIGGDLGVGSIYGYDGTGSEIPVTVMDDLNITGDVDVSGALSADSLITTTISTDDAGNAVVINDGLIVNGPGASRIDGSLLNVNAVLRANNSIISMADGGAAAVLIDDDLNISGEIGHPTPGEPVTVDDDFDVYGSIKNTSTSPTAFNLIEIILPLQRPVTIDDSLDVTGLATFEQNINAEGLILNIADDGKGGTLPVAIHDALTVKDTAVFSSNLNVNGNINATADVTITDDLTVTDDATINGDLTVIGAAKASRFGTYTPRPSVWLPVQGETVGTQSASCNLGEQIVSCGVDTASNSNGSGDTWGFRFMRVEATSSTCYVHARNLNSAVANSDSDARYLRAIAMCLDPDL